MAFITSHKTIRTYHKRDLALTEKADSLCVSLFCDSEQPEDTFAPFWEPEDGVRGVTFSKNVSLDWTKYQSGINVGHEAGSETVRGGYVWIATRLTAALAVNWLTANSARDPAVLELGAGTGVVGLFAAQVTRGPVYLSDGNPAMLQLLKLNTALNTGPRVHPALHVWGQGIELPDSRDDAKQVIPHTFELIVASDVLYTDEDVTPLWASIDRYLARSTGAAFLIGHQERHTVVMHNGIVGEAPEDDALAAFLVEGAARGFNYKRHRFPCLVDDEELIHLLEFTRS